MYHIIHCATPNMVGEHNQIKFDIQLKLMCEIDMISIYPRPTFTGHVHVCFYNIACAHHTLRTPGLTLSPCRVSLYTHPT